MKLSDFTLNEEVKSFYDGKTHDSWKDACLAYLQHQDIDDPEAAYLLSYRFLKKVLPEVSAQEIALDISMASENLPGPSKETEYELDQIDETASAGGTSAGGVASVMGGFGGDPKSSIYYGLKKKKDVDEEEEEEEEDDEPVIIRRPKIIESEEDGVVDFDKAWRRKQGIGPGYDSRQYFLISRMVSKAELDSVENPIGDVKLEDLGRTKIGNDWVHQFSIGGDVFTIRKEPKLPK